eukprot:1609504-Amphidinium_carterae.1
MSDACTPETKTRAKAAKGSEVKRYRRSGFTCMAKQKLQVEPKSNSHQDEETPVLDAAAPIVPKECPPSD